mgnify:CR=1 FL=1
MKTHVERGRRCTRAACSLLAFLKEKVTISSDHPMWCRWRASHRTSCHPSGFLSFHHPPVIPHSVLTPSCLPTHPPPPPPPPPQGFAALTIEGGLIAPDQVQAIASAAPDQKTAADYGCPKGTGLRDEITRYFRIAQAQWQTYARLEQPTMQQTAEFARNLLEQAFGFELTGPHHHTREDRRFTVAWEAKGGRVPVVIAPPAPAEKGPFFMVRQACVQTMNS